MSKTFEDREKGFERKFAHDEEMQFRARARRNRLFGLWVAGQLGIPDSGEVDAYAQKIIRAGSAGRGDEAVLTMARDDLGAKGATVSEVALAGRLSDFLAEARAQLLAAEADDGETSA